MFETVVSIPVLLIAMLIFGFAPGTVLRLIALAFPRDDPRRRELRAELYAVPRLERPVWVCEQAEVALFEGVWPRIRWAATGRLVDRWSLKSGLVPRDQHPDSFEIPTCGSRSPRRTTEDVLDYFAISRSASPGLPMARASSSRSGM